MSRTTRTALIALIVAGAAFSAAPSVGAAEGHSSSDAPHGFHTVTVTKAAFSFAIPNAWQTATDEAPFSTTTYLQVAFTNAKTVSLVLVLLLPGTTLPPASALRDELVTKLQHIHITHTHVAGKSALEASGTMEKKSASGVAHTVYQSIFLVPGPNGLLDFNFGGKVNAQHDKTLQTIIHSVVLLG